MVKRNVLLTPGPATTADSVKLAQIVPDICPREKEFGVLMESISNDLARIAGGENTHECVLFGGSGTAAMDCAINSVIGQHGRVLIINNGAYGKRLEEIADAYSIDYTSVPYNWDEEIDLHEIESMVINDNGINYIAMIHHETTTGILNPVKEVGEIAKKHGCTFLVDAISSFAGIPFSVRDYNIDFMFSTSNKCIQGMPGVFFIVGDRKKLEETKNNPKRSYYLNLYNQYDFFRKTKQMPFTPPVQTLYALRKAVDEFLIEGAEGRYERYMENNKILVSGMQELGFKKIFDKQKESGLLTTFYEPEHPNYSFNKMHNMLYEKEFTIYPGKIKEKTFRLANIGEIYPLDIRNFLDAMGNVVDTIGLYREK